MIPDRFTAFFLVIFCLNGFALTSSELAAAMRSETIDAMRQLALDPVVLEDGQSNLGCVETRQPPPTRYSRVWASRWW